MKSTFISKEKNDVTFTMEFTGEELEQGKVKAYQMNKQKFEVDGFRKGKAPRSIIERKFGEDIFVEEAVDSLVNGSYYEGVMELKLEVIDSPRMTFSKIEKETGFTVTVQVEVYPEVEIKDYMGVEVERADAEVSEEEIDAEVAKMQKSAGRMVTAERPAKDGDKVLIDYKGFVGEEQFEGGTAEKYLLELGSNTFIPGFEEQLVGTTAGEEVDVKVSFPEEYQAENLAGKEAVFKCLVHEVKEEELPEIDDEFAKDVSEFDTLEDLRNDIKAKMADNKKVQAENKMKDDVLKKVYEANDIEIPNSMLENEKESMIAEVDQQLRAQGLDMGRYLEYTGKTILDIREEVSEEATKRLKTRMIVRAVAEANNLEASNEDVENEIAEMATQYKMEATEIKERLGEENIEFLKRDLRLRKAIELMYEKAVIK